MSKNESVNETIRFERQQFYEILEALPAMVCLLTSDYQVIFANRPFRERFGEARGRHCHEYIWGFSEPCLFCESFKALETGRSHFWKVNAPDGTIIDVYDFPFTDSDGSSLVLEIDIDVTERDRMMNVLRWNELTLKESQRIAHLGSWEVDVAMREARWSEELFRIFGWPSQKEPLLFDAVMEATHSDDRENVILVFKESLKTREPRGLEHRIIHSDGSIRWVYISVGVVLDDVGEVVRFMGTTLDITDRKLVEEGLRRRAEEVEGLLEVVPAVVFVASDSTCLNITGNQQANQLFEAEPGENLSASVFPDVRRYYSPDGQEITASELPMQIAATMNREVRDVEMTIKAVSGRICSLLGNAIPLRNEHGEVRGCIGAFIDITERKRIEHRLELASRVFFHACEAIAITDPYGRVIEVNETYAHITGYTREETLGQLLHLLQSDQQPQDFYADMWHDLAIKDHWYGELLGQRKNGDLFAAMLTISSVKDAEGKIENFVALFADITRLKEYQRQLERTAHYDVLTGLPNRVLLTDHLQQALVRARRSRNSLAVAYLDLDGFKAVNDRHGHDVGDEFLVGIGKHMKAALREGDTLARIGGDEFVAVLADLNECRDHELVVTRLLKAATKPVQVRSFTLRVSASIGVTCYPEDDGDADELLRHADQAMYVAKQTGRNRYQLFDIIRDLAERTKHDTLGQLRRAIDRCEFVLHYQPKVNLRTGAVVGVEALIRWQHPDRGLLQPADFLSLVEEYPLSVQLGEWVIDAALTQVAVWQEAGLELTVSVNIGACHLQQHDFVSRLRKILASHPCVPPERLEFEILESSALKELDHVLIVMGACDAFGVRFSLDDFGTGFCSLAYLRDLPVEVLKIDQSFIKDMLEDPGDLAIVKGVVGMARAFRREVIAEGVESVEHSDLLLAIGCDLAQGYGIARPMPADELPGWVADWRSKH